jgi:hypothetical protein
MRALDGPASDLDVLEIDSPGLRWLAARDYIAEQGQAVSRQINAVVLIAEFVDLAEQNAIRRLGREALCIILDRGDWGVPLVAVDYLTARSMVLGRYEGKTRDKARDILDEFVPPNLRKGAK